MSLGSCNINLKLSSNRCFVCVCVCVCVSFTSPHTPKQTRKQRSTTNCSLDMTGSLALVWMKPWPAESVILLWLMHSLLTAHRHDKKVKNLTFSPLNLCFRAECNQWNSPKSVVTVMMCLLSSSANRRREYSVLGVRWRKVCCDWSGHKHRADKDRSHWFFFQKSRRNVTRFRGKLTLSVRVSPQRHAVSAHSA